MDPARGIRNDGFHQSAVHSADFKLDVGNALGFVGLVDLDQLQAACGDIFKGDGLGVIGVHLDSLALGVRIDDIAGERFDFLHDYRAHNTGDFDLAQGIRCVEAVGGNLSAVQVHVGAVGVGDFEFHTRQRLLGRGVDLVDDQSSGFLVPKGQALGLALLDEDALGLTVKDITVQGLGFFDGDGRARGQAGDGNAPISNYFYACRALERLHNKEQRLNNELYNVECNGGHFAFLVPSRPCRRLIYPAFSSSHTAVRIASILSRLICDSPARV